jgi:hypothetical protein
MSLRQRSAMDGGGDEKDVLENDPECVFDEPPVARCDHSINRLRNQQAANQVIEGNDHSCSR